MFLKYRIEPFPAVDDIEHGLAAPVHDALWFLTRQWQLGEFKGNDAGTPAGFEASGSVARISVCRAGEPDGWIPYDPVTAPLEVWTEPAPVADLRLRLYTGEHLMRLLAQAGLAARVAGLVERFPCQPASTDPLLSTLAQITPDGIALLSHLRKVAGNEFSSDLDFIPVDERNAFIEAARKWLAWREAESFLVEEGRPFQSWDPHRMEHGVQVASSAHGGTVLSAAGYNGDELDWSDFVIDPKATVSDSTLEAPRPLKLQGLPTPLRFGGMPAARYWELEDNRVDFGRTEAGGHDLGRLMLIQFAMVYGNDWFLVPLRIPSGSLTDLEEVVVTDVFGVSSFIPRIGSANSEWDMFALDTTDGSPHPAQASLFLPPTFSLRLESQPAEIVHFLRDEMANLAWAVEARIESVDGNAIEGSARRHPRPVPALASTDAPPKYEVQSAVPEDWFPLAPEQKRDGRSYRLVLVPLLRAAAIAPALPLARVLQPPASEDALWLHEEEIPRAGAIVEVRYRRIRWHGGRTFIWAARRKQTGRGEGSSGLSFDRVIPE